MHICFIGEYAIPGAETGGMGTFVKNLSEYLVGKGHHITVITFTEEMADAYLPQNEKLHIYVFNPLAANMLSRFWRRFTKVNDAIRKVHRVRPIDIVETNENGLFGINKIKGVKYIVRLHGGHYFFTHTTVQQLNKRKAFAEKRTVAKANAIIGVTDYAYNITAQYLPIKKLPWAIIPYPIFTNKFYSADAGKVIAGKIIFVGSVISKKGIRELILALPMVQLEFPHAHLDIYGREILDEATGLWYAEEMKKLVAAAAIPAVTFMGKVENDALPQILEQASVCAFPSHSETQGIVVLEAMAMGKLVVFSNTGPGKETIDHGFDGLLCNPQDPADIAAQIIWALGHPTETAIMGVNARQKVLSKYNMDEVGEKNIAFYSKVLAAKP